MSIYEQNVTRYAEHIREAIRQARRDGEPGPDPVRDGWIGKDGLP